MNAEFQRTARRDKKAFLSDQCKEIEENNRMGKTRDLFQKIRDTKGTFHVKIGSIKDRNGMDLTEAEDIKKRWQEYTEGKGKVAQLCLTLCNPMDCSLPGFNFYAEYIMRNTGLEEAQAGIKIAWRNSITSDMQMIPPLWQKVKKN